MVHVRENGRSMHSACKRVHALSDKDITVTEYRLPFALLSAYGDGDDINNYNNKNNNMTMKVVVVVIVVMVMMMMMMKMMMITIRKEGISYSSLFVLAFLLCFVVVLVVLLFRFNLISFNFILFHFIYSISFVKQN